MEFYVECSQNIFFSAKKSKPHIIVEILEYAGVTRFPRLKQIVYLVEGRNAHRAPPVGLEQTGGRSAFVVVIQSQHIVGDAIWHEKCAPVVGLA